MRKKLTEGQLRDAARLKQLFDERTPLTQLQFGERYDIGTQSTVWQYLSGYQPLNLSVLLKFSRGLGVPPQCISPTLAAELEVAGLVQIKSEPFIEEAVAVLQELPLPLRRQSLALLQLFATSHGKEGKDNKSKSYSTAA